MVVLLALLNDLPIMMIAYDNAPFAPQPVRWDMMRVLTIASVLGSGPINSLSMKRASDSLQRGEALPWVI